MRWATSESPPLHIVTLRDFFLENFAGDLEYHPRRALVYLGLAMAALCFWLFSSPETRFSAVPLVFLLGSLALIIKGIFLLRKSSEGLGPTSEELARLSDPATRKSLPSVPNHATQIVQDFGAGSLLLWPLLNVGKSAEDGVSTTYEVHSGAFSSIWSSQERIAFL
jgi:hypothetical protein